MKPNELALAMYADGTPWPRIMQFLRFHKKHPYVWPQFCDAAQAEMLEAKHEQIGAKAIWERMRRTAEKQTGMQWALDNNMHSLYARAFVARWPMYRDVFEFRKLTKEVA